jgi:transcriptional regulator with XRE-family HTH domain
MKSLKKWLAVAGVGLALMTATVVALPAAASETAVVQAQRGGASDEYLAQALGVSADELEAAKQIAYQAAIDQALADGLITQAQADAIVERAAASGRLSSRYLRGFTAGDSTIDVDALLAEALDVTADQIDAARTEAQSLALAAAVEAGDITQEQADQQQARQALKSYLDEQGFSTQAQSLYETLVQQAVQAGVLTQEQADTILSDADFSSLGGRHGLDGGRGGRHGLRGLGDVDSSGSTPQTDTPSNSTDS